jgi:hypothetical protein
VSSSNNKHHHDASSASTGSLWSASSALVANSNLTNGSDHSFESLPPLELSTETVMLVSPSVFSIQVRLQIVKDLCDKLTCHRASVQDVDMLVYQTLDMFQLPVGVDTRVELGTDAIVHQLHAKALGGSTGPSSPDSGGDHSSASLGTEPAVYVASSADSVSNGTSALHFSPTSNALSSITSNGETNAAMSNATITEVCTLRIELLRLYARLVQHCPTDISDVLRRLMFHVLSECATGSLHSACPQVGPYKEQLAEVTIALFRSLTSDGKTLIGFRAETDQLLLNWIKCLMSDRSIQIKHFLPLLVNAVRYNASAFSRSALSALIDVISGLFRDTFDADAGTAPECSICLELFDVMLRYAFVPPERIEPYTQTLCMAANNATLRPFAWQVMRNLLACELHYAILSRLLALVRNASSAADHPDRVFLLQVASGAIQCLGQALWGSVERADRIAPIKYQRSCVLRVFADALDLNNEEIALQVAAALKLLLEFQFNRFKNHSASGAPSNPGKSNLTDVNDDSFEEDPCGFDLSIVFRNLVWETLLRLCFQYESLLGIRTLDLDAMPDCLSTSELLVLELGQLAVLAEKLFLQRRFRSDDKLFQFLEAFSTFQMREYHYNDELPNAMVGRVCLLVDEYEQRIHSTNEAWKVNVTRLMELFYRQNTHTGSRIKALRLLHNRVKLCRDQDEVNWFENLSFFVLG